MNTTTFHDTQTVPDLERLRKTQSSWTLQSANATSQAHSHPQFQLQPRGGPALPTAYQRAGRVAPSTFRPQTQSAFGAIGSLAAAPLGSVFNANSGSRHQSVADLSNISSSGQQPAAAAASVPVQVVCPTHRKNNNKEHRGELALHEKYRYDLSRAQLKASSRTSALLAGFAMVALVELQYDRDTPRYLLVLLGVVTTLLVSVHLLALMISTCLLPYIEANGCTQDSPHIRLSKYIELSWLFSTCIGLVLFLLEIGIIFYMKFESVGFELGGYITTAMLVPVLVVFTVLSCLIHRNRFSHSMERVNNKVVDLEKFIDENELHPSETTPPALQSVNVVK